jgi:hypothetical protein
MNSNLYDKIVSLPESLVTHLTDSFNSVEGDSNVEGFNRNQELRDSKQVTYQQIKRIKNWFDGYTGNKEDAPFILNGGDRMNQWCDEVLRVWRESDKSGKKTKMDAGMQNQFIDSHEKNGFKSNPLSTHTKTNSDIDVRTNEEVNRINKLIQKIL